MGELGSQTLGMFIIGENAARLSVTAQASPTSSSAKTTAEAFDREISVGDSVIGDYSLGESITTTQSVTSPQTVTVNTSSKSVSLTSTATTSDAEANYFLGDKDLGNESLGTPLTSETSGTGGITTKSNVTSRVSGAVPATSGVGETTTGNSNIILAASSDSFAVAGETLTIDTSPKVSIVDTETVSTGSVTASESSTDANESISRSIDGTVTQISSNTELADSISDSASGLVTELSAQLKTSIIATSTVSDANTEEALLTGIVSPTDNAVTGLAFESALTTENLALGNAELGDGLTTQTMSMSGKVGEISPALTALGQITQTASSSLSSDSESQSADGSITAGSSNTFGSTGSTSADSSADIQTLVPATVLGASGNTVAVGGETVSVLASPLSSIVDSETTSDVDTITATTLTEALESITQSSDGAITQSSLQENEAQSISESVAGLILVASTQTSVSEGQPASVSDSALATTNLDTFLAPSSSATTAIAFGEKLSVGDFSLGDSELAQTITAENASLSGSVGDGVTDTTSDSQRAQTLSNTFLAGVTTETVAGTIQTVSPNGLVSPVSASTTSSADLQTLVTATVLGASADTFAVGGETVTLTGTPVISPVLSETTSDGSRAASAVSSVQSPVLSKSLSESVASSLSASVKRSPVLSESIGGLIQDLQSDPSVSQADTVTVSKALFQKPDILSATIDPDTRTVGQGFRLLGLGDKVSIGNFKLGEGPTTQTAIGTSTDSVPEAKATPQVRPVESFGESLLSDSVSEGIGGTITPSASETFLADSQSDSTGGVVQTLFGEAGVGIPFTETDSDGDLSTLVSGTVLASTADTEAVAGETVSLLFSPFDAIVDSRATSESLISTVNSAISLSESESFATANSIETLLSSFGVSSTVKTTSISDSVKSLSAGSSLEVNPFTETIGFAPPPIIRVGSEDVSGFKLGKSDRANQTINSSSIRVDADTASQSESEITASSLETLLSPSVSASSGGTITTVRSTIFLAQVDATAESDGTVATLVPATVLAATADTAASGGETLTLKLKPITVDPDTSSISDVPVLTDISTAPQLDFGLAKSTSESSLILIESTTTTVNALAETTALGRKIKSVYNLLTVDPETLAQAEPETTKSSIITILSQASTKSTAELSPKLINMIPLEGFRFLPSWTLNQRILGDTIDEVRNWNLIEITSRVEKETVVKDVRPLTPGVGAVDVISTSDGGYEVVKRGGSNEVTLEAATERDDVRPVETWYLQNISEEVIGSEGQQYEVTIEALPVQQKAFDNSLGNLTSPFPDETRTQGFWKYEFEKGSIVTRRVTTDIEREPTNELKSVTVSFLAEPEEVRVMEENLSKLNAVAERDVPDGTNIVEDSTSDKRHIVDVTPPQDARDTVEAGEYYVTEWETEYQQSRAYIVQMNLVENEN